MPFRRRSSGLGRVEPNLDIQELKEEIISEAPKEKADEVDEVRTLKSRLASLHFEEAAYVSTARRNWSRYLGWCIAVSLIFQIVLTIAVGRKFLDFGKYPGFLAVVAGGTFAQVVGLAAIVLKWIFGGKHPDELLQEEQSARRIR